MKISKEVVVTCERTFDKTHFNFLSYKLLMHREYMALHAVFNRIVNKWNWRMPDLKRATSSVSNASPSSGSSSAVVLRMLAWRACARQRRSWGDGLLGSRSPVCACPCQCEHCTNGARGNFRKSSCPRSTGPITPHTEQAQWVATFEFGEPCQGSCTLSRSSTNKCPVVNSDTKFLLKLHVFLLGKQANNDWIRIIFMLALLE